MRRLRPGSGLLVALLVVLSAGACSPLDDAMVAVFGRSMRDQPSFDPYEDPRLPAERAVPFAVGDYVAASPGSDSLAAGEWLGERPPPITQLQVTQSDPAVTGIENPVEPTAESLARGEEVFMVFCAPCHGPDGSGATGYVVDAGMPPMPLTTPNAVAHSDGMLYGLITAGRGIMPAYGHRIPYRNRWHVVNYVRELQGQGSAAGAAADTTAAGAAGADTAAADTASGGSGGEG